MSQCTDVNAAISNLSAKVDSLQSRLNQLENSNKFALKSELPPIIQLGEKAQASAAAAESHANSLDIQLVALAGSLAALRFLIMPVIAQVARLVGQVAAAAAAAAGAASLAAVAIATAAGLKATLDILGNRIDQVESQNAMQDAFDGRLVNMIGSVKAIANRASATASDAKDKAEDSFLVAKSASGRADLAQATASEALKKAEKAQSAATTAKTTADKAQSTSDNAQRIAESSYRTATTAKVTADKAQSTATTASEKADTAKVTAIKAQSSADTASKKADTATAKATDALSTANNAQSTAEQALTTAQSIRPKAEQALSTANNASSTATTAKTKADKVETEVISVQSIAFDSLFNANSAKNLANNAQQSIDQVKNNIANLFSQNSANIQQRINAGLNSGLVNQIFNQTQQKINQSVVNNPVIQQQQKVNQQFNQQITNFNQQINQINIKQVNATDNRVSTLQQEVTTIKNKTLENEKVNQEGINKLNAMQGSLAAIPVLIGMVSTLPQTFASNPTFMNAATTAAAAGTCQSTRPGGCLDGRFNGLQNSFQNGLNGVTNTLQSAGLAGIGVIGAAVTRIEAQLAGLTGSVATLGTLIGTNFSKTWEFLKLDRLLNILTFAATVHNAAMLSNDILQTLVGAINNVLGFIVPKDANGASFVLTDVINSTVENAVKGVIGAENYTELSQGWAKANRIYQASMNVVNNVLNLSQVILMANEMIAGYTGQIGNALKKGGVVLENAYGWMNPQPKFNRVTQGLESLQVGASTVQMVTQVPVDAVNAVTELNNSATELRKTFKEDNKPENKAPAVPEPDQLKAKETTAKTASQPVAFNFSDLFDGEDLD